MRHLKILMLRSCSLERSPHVVTVANFLDRAGFDVVLATLVEGRRPARLSAGVQHACFGSTPAVSVRARIRGFIGEARWFRRLIRAQAADVLYVIDHWSLPRVIAAGGWSPRRGRVLVYHSFDWMDPHLLRAPNRFHRWWERPACLRADLCVNVDRSRARMMQALYRLDRMPLWIPNFPLRDEEAPPRDETLRAELLGPEGRFLVICPAQATRDRLCLELIQAIALLPSEYRLVTFHGPGEYGEKCRELARSGGLRGRVRFLDPRPYDELAPYVSCADIGVVLSDWRANSGDYMANSGRLAGLLCAAVPVVAFDVPNLAALVYKWGLGECCDCYDPASIAEAVATVAEGPPGLEERRRRIRLAVQQELHFERRGHLLAQELRRLASPGEDLRARCKLRFD